jgi:hypothetical protein
MADRALRSLPTNFTGETRVLARMDETLLDSAVSDAPASVALEKALPIRESFSWRGKRNYEGVWWSSTTRRHVAFESLLEREFLMAADFDGEVLGVSSQPLAFLWPRETEYCPLRLQPASPPQSSPRSKANWVHGGPTR